MFLMVWLEPNQDTPSGMVIADIIVQDEDFVEQFVNGYEEVADDQASALLPSMVSSHDTGAPAVCSPP